MMLDNVHLGYSDVKTFNLRGLKLEPENVILQEDTSQQGTLTVL